MAFTKKTKQTKHGVVGTRQQETIWQAITDTNSHIIVEARAGTGKTYTIIEALKRLPVGIEAKFVCFNKAIADELSLKVPSHVEACTLHSLGNRALRNTYPKIKLDRYKTDTILQEITYSKKNIPLNIAVSKLVSFCKANLVDGKDQELLSDLILEYDITIQRSLLTDVYDLVPKVLAESMFANKYGMDFDDMIYLPLALGVNIPKVDLLFVDEAQDLNKSQQELAIRAGKRLVLVGDPKQAIYAFRGADSKSMVNMEQMLVDNRTDNQFCSIYPLTVTRRCPRSIVTIANTLVNDLEALPDAPEGDTYTIAPTAFLDTLAVKDMVLCRVNAPLVRTAYELIRRDTPVRIQGRDFGQGLTKLINRLAKDDTVHSLLAYLRNWHEKEATKIRTSKKYPDKYLEALDDKFNCIYYLCEGLESVRDVIARIEKLFSDTASKDSVLLSSVHRAKGLETDRVFILSPELMPHPMAKTETDKQGELNVLYVAITRAKKELFFIGSVPSPLKVHNGKLIKPYQSSE